ncbi:MAG: AAA family ATPase [Longimicrobiales bacterium]|nr:AAA family ATPase [Longimicrobiales bacterium]
MSTLGTKTGASSNGAWHAGQQPGQGGQRRLGAALISADDRLRTVVFETLRDAGLPIEVTVELAASSHFLEAEHLERLRSAAPHVVILDMTDDPERAIRSAGAIASGNPNAALVGVGPELDASGLLDAMRAGLVEYVPRPVEPTGIREALGRVMHKRGWSDSVGGSKKGKLMAFFSPKGGSGSTSVVTNVGIELHRLTGRKTLLVDLDLELGEMASMLGVRPRFHFIDLIRNFHRMDADLLASYIESHESGVHVLSAPFEPEIGEEVTGEQILGILGFLRNHYDYVLVDTSKSLAPPALAALQNADPIFLVTNMDVPSLRNLKRCLPTLDRVTAGDASRLRLVVNRFNPKSLVSLADLEETLGIEVDWTLTNDYETVIQSISTGRPLVLHGRSQLADQLKELARDIVGGSATGAKTGRSLVSRLMGRLATKSSKTRAPLGGAVTEAPSHG